MAIADYLTGKEKKIKEHIDADSQDVTRFLIEEQGTTFVFSDLNGGKAVGNLFSTREKIAKAIGVEPDKVLDCLSKAVDKPIKPKTINKPRFRLCSVPVDLTKLPIPKYFPKDGGRYITSGIVVSEYDGKRNVSFHRLMIVDKDTIAIRLVPRHLYKMNEAARAKKEELKISICIGAPPQVLISAATPVAYDVDEMCVASSFTKIATGKPLEVGKCDNGLLVPEGCDYVLEGRITLKDMKEGPFVDITGTYDCVRKQPVVKIDKIWSVRNPMFHLLLPGGWEHYLFMGVPREPMILKACKKAGVDVKHVRLTEGGCCWLNGVVSIKKKKDSDGKTAIKAAFEGHPSMKNVTIVDDDIDIFDDKEVEWAITTRFQADRIVIVPKAKGSSLDPSAVDSITNKVGIDATIPKGMKWSDFVKATLD